MAELRLWSKGSRGNERLQRREGGARESFPAKGNRGPNYVPAASGQEPCEFAEGRRAIFPRHAHVKWVAFVPSCRLVVRQVCSLRSFFQEVLVDSTPFFQNMFVFTICRSIST